MNRNPLDRVGRANRVEKPLVLREDIACRVLHRERNEHDRVAIDRDLERLQFALREISPDRPERIGKRTNSDFSQTPQE